MPETVSILPVNGTVAIDGHGTMLVLSERLDGHDTFLTGQLQLEGIGLVTVRILTFDDVTVLRVLDQPMMLPSSAWIGFLHVPHGWRKRAIPDDLALAATSAHRDLAALDEAELRYALTFLGEASTAAIWRQRIEAIVHALPRSDGDAE